MLLYKSPNHIWLLNGAENSETKYFQNGIEVKYLYFII